MKRFIKFFLLVIFIVLGCYGCAWYTSEHYNQINDNLGVMEKRRHKYSFYTGIAENGCCIIIPLPFPIYEEEILEQEVLFNNKIIWSEKGTDLHCSFYPSPDEKLILIEDKLHIRALEILNINNSEIILIDDLDIKDDLGIKNSCGSYPFRFLQWIDNDHILCEVKGLIDYKTNYRDVWKINAVNMNKEKIQSEELKQ